MAHEFKKFIESIMDECENEDDFFEAMFWWGAISTNFTPTILETEEDLDKFAKEMYAGWDDPLPLEWRLKST